jgi:hypothetical protein
MTIRAAILAALHGCAQPVGGREVASMTGLRYKSAIDALNRLLDMGRVYRLGRTHTARWTTTPPHDPALDAAAALDAAWFGAARAAGRRHSTPTPPGGRGEAGTPRPKNF